MDIKENVAAAAPMPALMRPMMVPRSVGKLRVQVASVDVSMKVPASGATMAMPATCQYAGFMRLRKHAQPPLKSMHRQQSYGCVCDTCMLQGGAGTCGPPDLGTAPYLVRGCATKTGGWAVRAPGGSGPERAVAGEVEQRADAERDPGPRPAVQRHAVVHQAADDGEVPSQVTGRANALDGTLNCQHGCSGCICNCHPWPAHAAWQGAPAPGFAPGCSQSAA